MSALNWKHHALIQALLARGPQTERDLSRRHRKKPRFNSRCRLGSYLSTDWAFDVKCCEIKSIPLPLYDIHILCDFDVIEAIVQDARANGYISIIDALNIHLENQLPTENGSQSQDGVSPKDGVKELAQLVALPGNIKCPKQKEFDNEPNDASQSQPHAEPSQSQQPLGSKRKKPPRTSRTNDAEILDKGHIKTLYPRLILNE